MRSKLSCLPDNVKNYANVRRNKIRIYNLINSLDLSRIKRTRNIKRQLTEREKIKERKNLIAESYIYYKLSLLIPDKIYTMTLKRSAREKK